MDASSRNRGSDCETYLPDRPEKVEIIFDAADEPFRELRIENKFAGADGHLIALSDGVQLDVTVEAEINDSLSAANS